MGRLGRLFVSFSGTVAVLGFSAYYFYTEIEEFFLPFNATLLERRRHIPACRYFISSDGSDGVGHQIEAKLSCLAAAVTLNMTYVHFPIERLEHGTDPTRMEDLFGLSRTIAKLFSHHKNVTADYDGFATEYDPSIMERADRSPVPWVGHCNEANWFDYKLQEGLDQCDYSGSKIQVHTNDNCWGYFWCHTNVLPSLWQESIVPVLRESFLEPFQTAGTGRKKEIGTLYVAIHFRRGDVSPLRSVPYRWYRTVLNKVIEAAKARNISRFDVTIHSDAPHEIVQRGMSLTERPSLHVAIYGRDDVEGTLEQAVHDMVTCDVFIASKSSLSHAASFMRSAPVLHPPTDERPRMVHMGWSMLKITGIWWWKKVYHCVRAPPEQKGRACKKWEEATSGFWSQLVATAVDEEAERFPRHY